MAFFTSRRSDKEELIDSVAPDSRDFAAAFTDICRINRFLGGTAAVQNALCRLLEHSPDAPRTVRVLDVATGGADIPRTLVQAARKGAFGPRRLHITATDIHPKLLQIAQNWTPITEYPEICIEAADAFSLPYPDGAFDYATCSLAFHHFGFEQCIHVLREMDRVTTRGLVVNDLVRGRLPAALIWALTRLFGANYLTRHDAPLSVMRAYTLREYRDMVEKSGISNCAARPVPMFRAVLVQNKITGYKIK